MLLSDIYQLIYGDSPRDRTETGDRWKPDADPSIDIALCREHDLAEVAKRLPELDLSGVPREALYARDLTQVLPEVVVVELRRLRNGRASS